MPNIGKSLSSKVYKNNDNVDNSNNILTTENRKIDKIIKILDRSTHQRCSVKKEFLEISQHSQENTCVRVSFLIKLQVPDFINVPSRLKPRHCPNTSKK